MRPQPTPADRAAAIAFVAETYEADPAVSRVWIEGHRPDLVRYSADAEMQKRMGGEHRARFAPRQRRAA